MQARKAALWPFSELNTLRTGEKSEFLYGSVAHPVMLAGRAHAARSEYNRITQMRRIGRSRKAHNGGRAYLWASKRPGKDVLTSAATIDRNGLPPDALLFPGRLIQQRLDGVLLLEVQLGIIEEVFKFGGSALVVANVVSRLGPGKTAPSSRIGG